MAGKSDKIGGKISAFAYIASVVIIILIGLLYVVFARWTEPEFEKLRAYHESEPLLFLADFKYGIDKAEFNEIAQTVSPFTEHDCTASREGMEMCFSAISGSGVEEAVFGLFKDDSLVGLSYWGNFSGAKTAEIVQMTELITYNFRKSFKEREGTSGSLTFLWEKNGHLAVQFVQKSDENYIVNFTQYPETYTTPMVDAFQKAALLFGIIEDPLAKDTI